MNFFVTGASGLLGSYVVKLLLTEGYNVTATYRNEDSILKTKNVFELNNDYSLELFSKIKWVNADVCNPLTLEDFILPEHTVVHCAGMVSFLPSHEKAMYEANINGTKNMVNICTEKKVKKFIHISSVATLCKDVPLRDELAFQRPQKEAGFYSKSKYIGELEVWRGIQEGLNAVILSPSIILGAYNWQSGSSKMFEVSAKGLLFYTSGKTGFVDVKDVAKAVLIIAKSPIHSQRYCLNSENWFYKEFFNFTHTLFGNPIPKYKAGNFLTGIYWRYQYILSKFTKKDPLVTKESARTANKMRAFSGEKFKSDFNFSFRPLQETIMEIVEIYKKSNA